MRQGWAVGYLWLRGEENFTDSAVDALVDYHRQLIEERPERLRIYLYDGRLYRVGSVVPTWRLSVQAVPRESPPAATSQRLPNSRRLETPAHQEPPPRPPRRPLSPSDLPRIGGATAPDEDEYPEDPPPSTTP